MLLRLRDCFYKHQRMVFVRSVVVFGAAVAAVSAGVELLEEIDDDVILSHGKIQQCWHEVEDQRGFLGKFCITRYESVVPLDAFNHNREWSLSRSVCSVAFAVYG